MRLFEILRAFNEGDLATRHRSVLRLRVREQL
jgi:hypothetical protein